MARQGQRRHGGRVLDPGGLGDEPGGLPVEGVTGEVGPLTVQDAALLALDVLLPQRQEPLGPGLVERRVECTDPGTDTGGFVHEGAEDVEDEDVDVQL